MKDEKRSGPIKGFLKLKSKIYTFVTRDSLI